MSLLKNFTGLENNEFTQLFARLTVRQSTIGPDIRCFTSRESLWRGILGCIYGRIVPLLEVHERCILTAYIRDLGRTYEFRNPGLVQDDMLNALRSGVHAPDLLFEIVRYPWVSFSMQEKATQLVQLLTLLNNDNMHVNARRLRETLIEHNPTLR